MKKLILLNLITIISLSTFAQHDYAKAQHLSTRFLGAQRSGDTKSWILPEGSGGAFVNDGKAVNKDLSGGWHDCGDYIKFHVTGPYTALLNLYGYYKFPEAYPDNYSQDYSKAPGNGIPDVLDEVKIQTDYLIKCIDGNKIYWQIGDGRDHNTFNEPISASNQPLYNNTTIRPVYEATSGHSNAFGSAAAALALMSILYENYDATYAQQCLAAAQTYYTVGNTNPAITADARPQDGFYQWLGEQYSSYNDEMGMGAIMLYNATNQQSYLTQAQNFSNAAAQYGTFNYGSIDHLLFYEMYEVTNQQSYLNKVKWRVDNFSLTSCGYFHNTNWGSLRDAGNAALLAALYHRSTDDQNAYDFAKSNVDFILGTHGYISPDAPANFSFLIGYDELGGGFPRSPHHGPAFGKSNNAWTLYGNERDNPGSVPYEYQLSGGLAGGPETACGNFEDNINNYVSSEYCSYYNAAFTSAVAYINKVENDIITSSQNELINVQNVSVLFNSTNKEVILTLAGTLNYVVIDAQGKLVKNGSVFNQGKIDLQNLSTGVYFIKDTMSSWSYKLLVD